MESVQVHSSHQRSLLEDGISIESKRLSLREARDNRRLSREIEEDEWNERTQSRRNDFLS